MSILNMLFATIAAPRIDIAVDDIDDKGRVKTFRRFRDWDIYSNIAAKDWGKVNSVRYWTLSGDGWSIRLRHTPSRDRAVILSWKGDEQLIQDELILLKLSVGIWRR